MSGGNPSTNDTQQMLLSKKAIHISEIIKRFPTKFELWMHLHSKKKLNMPYWISETNRDKCLTWPYLMDVLCQRVATMPRVKVNLRDIKKTAITREELAVAIEAKAKKPVVTSGELPLKEWLLEVLFYYEPEHECFTGYKEPDFIRDLPAQIVDEILALPEVRVAGSRTSNFYTEEEKQEIRDTFQNRKKVKKDQKIKNAIMRRDKAHALIEASQDQPDPDNKNDDMQMEDP